MPCWRRPAGRRSSGLRCSPPASAARCFGAWLGSLAGTGAPNSRLKRYDRDLEAGKVLLMVDVPFARVDEIRTLVHRQHPEASGGTVEPTMPAFP